MCPYTQANVTVMKPSNVCLNDCTATFIVLTGHSSVNCFKNIVVLIYWQFIVLFNNI